MNRLLQRQLRWFSNTSKVNYGFRLQIMSKSKRTCNEPGCDRKRFKSTESIISSNLLSNKQFVEKIPTMHGIEVMDTPDKPETDKKSYRAIRLPNQMKVVLISDPSLIQDESEDLSHKCNGIAENTAVNSDACSSEDEDSDASSDEGSVVCDGAEDAEEKQKKEKQAACSLSVNVGSFSDPRRIQGLAHFLEHMIFMGSEKYPTENEFDQFISKNGGFDNAHTDLDDTVFYFEIQEQFLDGALDRFSQFFKGPLMLKEAMTREREAVDSEFTSKKHREDYRREQLLVSLGQPDHPSSIFSWGNLKTLRDDVDDESLYDKVHEFRKRHYSAHRMYLCIQARMNLDELQDLAVKHFSNVPNNQLPPDDFSSYTHDNAFMEKFYKKSFFVKAIKDTSTIQIAWCLPPILRNYKSKPEHYLSFLLGHEGEGSLLNYLRKKLWADDLVAGVGSDGLSSNSLFSIFDMCIHLTEGGFDHLDEVLESISSYIRFLKHVGPSERVFKEIQTIEDASFRFSIERDPIDNTEDVVENMKNYPSKHILSGDFLYFAYDANAIQEIIDFLNSPKFKITITSTRLYDNDVIYNLKEEWFGTEYCERDVPEKWLNLWQNIKPYDDFFLPAPNPFIADDFTIVYDKSTVLPKYPTKILENEVCELWYRQDDKFLLPHAFYNFFFISPSAMSSTKNMILMGLYSSLLKYQLVARLYPATDANLQYTCYTSEKGVVLRVEGYNQKLHHIVNAFVKSMTTLANDVTEEQFDVFVQEKFKDYANVFVNPASLGKHLRLCVLEAHQVSLIEKKQVLKKLKFQDFVSFCHEFLKEIRIECLMQGNLTEESAISIMEEALGELQCGKIEDKTAVELRTTKIPAGDTYLRCNSFNPNNVNTIITNFYQIGPISHYSRVLLDLLMFIAQEPLFDNLRSKEQLGYDVSCEVREIYGILGYTIKINSQEDKFCVEHIDERIESFRQELISIIEKLTDEEFQKFKESLAKSKLTEDHELRQEVSRNWTEITSGDYAFDWIEKEVEILKTLTKSELMEFYLKYLSESNRKLSTQIIGNPNAQQNQDDEEEVCREIENLRFVEFKTPKSNACLITDIKEFKSKLEVYPVTNTK